MRLNVERHGRKHRVWVESDDGELLASEVGDLADGRERKRIAEAILGAAPALKRDELAEKLLAESGTPATKSDDAAGGDGDAEKVEIVDPSTEEELAEAREILRSGDLIDQIERDLGEAGIVGEDELKLSLYLIATSRLLDQPLHAIIRGDSSSGKSFVPGAVARLMPPEGVVKVTHLSPKALYRMPNLEHRFLLLGERSRSSGSEQEDATKALRELRSERRLTLSTVVDGKLAEFHVEGPVASVETTTLEELFDEDANRCLLLTSDESSEQTARVTAAQAKAAAAGRRAGGSDRLARRHWAMQRLLAEEEAAVVVPFAETLAAAIPTQRVETRRAFPMLLAVVEASALVHRFQRGATDAGEILATLEDYALARRLVGSVLAASIADSPSDPVRRFFVGLRQHVQVGDEFTAPDLAGKLNRRRNRVNDLLRSLRPFGVIEQTEEAKGPHPATWQLLASNLPEGEFVLPPADGLGEGADR